MAVPGKNAIAEITPISIGASIRITVGNPNRNHARKFTINIAKPMNINKLKAYNDTCQSIPIFSTMLMWPTIIRGA